MALIDCPECGREVSGSAVACPECAYPVATGTPPIPVRAVAPSGGAGVPVASGDLEVTKRIVGRLLLGGFFMVSGAAFSAPPVVIGALAVWGSSIPIWIRARRAEKFGLGAGQGGRTARRVESNLEQRIAELEDRQHQQLAESEDRHQRQLADLEERVDFAERLLTKQREQTPP